MFQFKGSPHMTFPDFDVNNYDNVVCKSWVLYQYLKKCSFIEAFAKPLLKNY